MSGLSQVAVPDVAGLARGDAEAALRGAGLVVGTATTASSTTVAAGDAISTDPVAGALVNAGSTVDLELSSGPAQVAVPDVAGSTRAEAETALRGAGLVVGTAMTASSTTVAAGDAISTDPVAGTLVNSGSTVNLELSSGPTQVAIPDVTGLTQAAAETALTSAGLVVGASTTASSATIAAGNIIRTNPVAGTLVAPGSAVSSEASVGPPLVAVPHVAGLTQVAAETALRAAGLLPGTVSRVESRAVPAGGVNSSDPPAGSLVDRRSRIDLEISAGEGSRFWSLLPGAAIFAIVIVLLIVVIIGIYSADLVSSLADDKKARGLITFLVAIVTVGIALILLLSNAFADGEDAEKRFDRGKQVLMTMIGVLGTIVGFYFGSASVSPGNIQPTTPSAILSITTAVLPDGKVGARYEQAQMQADGGKMPLKWSIVPALPAGVSLNPDTGSITGTPIAASGRTNYKITVTDSAMPPASSTREIALEIKQ